MSRPRDITAAGPLNRRKFLGFLTVAAGLAALVGRFSPASLLRTAPTAAALRIGQRYLGQPGAARPLAYFEEAVFAGADPARLSPEEAHRLVAERSRQEFLQGEMIDVDGFRLARTEVHFCAFEYLRSQTAST